MCTAFSSSPLGAPAGTQTSRHIAMSEPSRRWISATLSGVKRAAAPSYTERNVTPSSSSARIVSRNEKIWKPPESVRIGPPHPENACSPPTLSMTPSPGRKWRWYAFPRITCAPSARTSSGWSDFTVAFVPTGMNAGVRISPCLVTRTPARAAPSVASTLKVVKPSTPRFAQPAPAIGATPCLLPLRAYWGSARAWETRWCRKRDNHARAPHASTSEHHHRVPERVEPVPLADSDAIELASLVDTDERHAERAQGRSRKVEVREQSVD